VINGPLTTSDTGSARPELYIIRRKGTARGTDALRLKHESHENKVCLLLFTTPLDAFEFLKIRGLDPDQWDFVGSDEFGGVVPLLKKASELSTRTPTHILINPSMEHGPVVVTPPTIESAIHHFESSPWAEQWNSGGPEVPFWLLRNEAGGEFGIVPEPGVMALCLFKSEMDAEECRHSHWIPDETPADEWECVWPANPDDAVAFLEEVSSKGISHAVINIPPRGGAQRPLIIPIEVIIDHVASRGHIQDLDSP
jgi:hypothetical protein